jgi:hypothetical protein
MFNKKKPFYGYSPDIYPVAYVGNMSKSSVPWQKVWHKGHPNIVEPVNLQAPLSEFDVFTRAPFGFGWYKTPMKNSFHLPVFGFSHLLN